MITKLSAVLMLALLALPSCCCLKSQDAEECEKDVESCCVSVEDALPTSQSPLLPVEGLPDPCDCEISVPQTLGLPENSILLTDNTQDDFSTNWLELRELPVVKQGDKMDSSLLTSLSAFHPPSWRSCQVNCVYRI